MGNPNTTGEVRCGTILKVAGPLIVATGMSDVEMFDVVRVSEKRLIGEVIELRGDKASIQVYEETAGLGPGEPVYSTGEPLSVELAPGLIESIFDGIQRPLNVIYDQAGDRITPGHRGPQAGPGEEMGLRPCGQGGRQAHRRRRPGHGPGDRRLVEHKIMMPPRLSGTVEWIFEGEATITEPIARVKKDDGSVVDVSMLQRWPVRRRRPYGGEDRPRRAHGHGSAGHRHPVPHRQGRHRGHPRALRLRQDRGAAPAGQVGRRRHHRLRGLRRAGQRNDRRAPGVPGAA